MLKSIKGSRFPQLSALDKESFAYATIHDRLPSIVTNVIDLLSRIHFTLNTQSQIESKDVINRLANLKYEMERDRSLTALCDYGEDVDVWNNYLKQVCFHNNGKLPSFYQSPWLYVECYMYRKIRECFLLSSSFHNFDWFYESKNKALESSLRGGSILANLLDLVDYSNLDSIRKYYRTFILASLWANRCDLSLSAGAQSAHNPEELLSVDKFNSYLLIDDISASFDALIAKKSEFTRIDLIADNCGFEIIADLCLSEFLLRANLCHQVVFHLKSFPWFVSDVTKYDFNTLLWKLQTSEFESLKCLSIDIQRRIFSIESFADRCDHSIAYHADTFWTTPFVYADMELVSPLLFNYLSQSALLIFKGDLNYRKLTGDIKWDFLTPFSESLLGFSPTSLLALRTLKADSVAGLQPGQAEKSQEMESNWLNSGSFGVISFVN